MTTMQSLAFSSPISHRPNHQHSRTAGLASSPWIICQSANSSFNGQSLQLTQPRQVHLRASFQASGTIKMVKPSIQFTQGTDEQTIQDGRLTKSRDGTNGMAIFSFDEPSVFDSSGELGDITGLYIIDEEGVLTSVDANVKVVNGKPSRIEAKYIMRTPRIWDDKDLRLVTDIVGGAIRWRRYLDHLIVSLCHDDKAFRDMEPLLLQILRIGFYEIS